MPSNSIPVCKLKRFFTAGILKGVSGCQKASSDSIRLFFFKLNCYRITPGTDIDQAKKNGGQAQGPQHQGIIADFKIIKEI
jgi:hypothetical protein